MDGLFLNSGLESVLIHSKDILSLPHTQNYIQGTGRLTHWVVPFTFRNSLIYYYKTELLMSQLSMQVKCLKTSQTFIVAFRQFQREVS